MTKYVIIAAGGIGARMKAPIPKQFLSLNDIPIIIHTINKFQIAISKIKIIVVLPKEQLVNWDSFCMENDFLFDHTVCEGGSNRFESIKNGLKHVHGPALVAIHDAVRPLVSLELIRNIYQYAEQNGNAVPAIPLDQSIRMVDGNKTKAMDRSLFRIIQTPQCFHSDLLLAAYAQDYQETFTDDASVVEQTGAIINLVEGEINNIKITTHQDMMLAETLVSIGI